MVNQKIQTIIEKNVRIDHSEITKFCEYVSSCEIVSPKPLGTEIDFNFPEERLNFELLFNSLNFCFWKEPTLEFKLAGQKYRRSMAFRMRLHSNYLSYPKLLSPEYLANISILDFSKYICNPNELLLFEDRLRFTQKTFQCLVQKYQNNLENLCEDCKYDALSISKRLGEEFESFKDTSKIGESTIQFNKKAQVLVSYISESNTCASKIDNIDNLTAFADYRLPQILRSLGILTYSENLAELVDNKMLIKKDSTEEISIRLSTIVAVDYIVERLRSNGFENVNARTIDALLWKKAHELDTKMKPHHRTISTCY